MLGRPYRLISQVDAPGPAESSRPQTVMITLKHNYNLVPAPGRYSVHATLKPRAQVEVAALSSCEAARRSLIRLDTELWIDTHITIHDEQRIEMPTDKYAQLIERNRSMIEGEGQGQDGDGNMMLLLEFVDGE